MVLFCKKMNSSESINPIHRWRCLNSCRHVSYTCAKHQGWFRKWRIFSRSCAVMTGFPTYQAHEKMLSKGIPGSGQTEHNGPPDQPDTVNAGKLDKFPTQCNA